MNIKKLSYIIHMTWNMGIYSMAHLVDIFFKLAWHSRFFFKSLQDEGMELNMKGQVCRFRGTICVVCADNLASWSLGGFKALSSALRKCRFCMAVADDMKSKVGI